MIPVQRRAAIIQKLLIEGSVTNDDLAKEFSVSLDTIRRDLRILSADGLVCRAHGGAIWADVRELASGVHRDPFLAEKRAIAHKALDFIRPGETITMDMGRTNVQLARSLYNTTRCRPIKVFTTDLRIGMILAKANGIEVCITGGIIGRRNHISGEPAISFLESIASDTLFLSTTGVTVEGWLSEPVEDVALIKIAALKNAKRKILLVDHSKFNRVFEHSVAPIEQVDVVITDRQCPADILARLKDIGVTCVLS